MPTKPANDEKVCTMILLWNFAHSHPLRLINAALHNKFPRCGDAAGHPPGSRNLPDAAPFIARPERPSAVTTRGV